MKLNSLHVLLTYRCNYECDHCFVWGSPQQSGVFTSAQLEDVFQQALATDCIRELYFEGGESFVYYPVLVKAVARAHELGFATGVVTNGYWATSRADARAWIEPLVHARLDKLEISCDSLHGETAVPPAEHIAIQVAKDMLLHANLITITSSNNSEDIMFRGRAAVKLVNGHTRRSWHRFTTCPHENLGDPERVHLDPFGNLHLCQGLVMGNMWERPLTDILATYNPQTHPIVRELLAGGPAQLVQTYDLAHESGYVDACHLCYTAREALRAQFPTVLTPDQMYGVIRD